MKNFISKKFTYAIVGASNDKSKYGNKVLLDLLGAGFKAIPINPKEDLIEGKKAFATLKDCIKNKIKIDVVVTVVPAHVTENIVKECKELNITKVWMQPGSESEDAIAFCEKNGIEQISNMCIMISR